MTRVMRHVSRPDGSWRAARPGMMTCWMLRAALVTASISCGMPVLGGLAGEDPLAVKDAIGRGTHAFFGGDFDRAYDECTGAIEAGTTDPRAFYFRGLAAMRLGRTAEAEADFAAGAEREAVDGSTLRISRALQRVQGCDRLTLERFRTQARLAGLQRDREASARRYSTIEDPSGELLRRRRPEDVGEDVLAPRPADDVEVVPTPRPTGPRGRARTPFGDDEPTDAMPKAAEPDAAAESAEEKDMDKESDKESDKEMASEPDEKPADEDAKGADAAGT